MNTVSYTHLDVYKRQFQYTAIDEFTRLRFLAAYPEQSKIGRASCRERV